MVHCIRLHGGHDVVSFKDFVSLLPKVPINKKHDFATLVNTGWHDEAQATGGQGWLA